jgi:hypothetical protein
MSSGSTAPTPCIRARRHGPVPSSTTRSFTPPGAAGWAARCMSRQEPWQGNEVEKRSALFALSDTIACPGDWVWVCDADEVVTDAYGVKDRSRARTLTLVR